MIEFKLLHKTPNETLCNSHYYCDYLELLALVDCDDGLSINDIYDRFLKIIKYRILAQKMAVLTMKSGWEEYQDGLKKLIAEYHIMGTTIPLLTMEIE